MPLYMDVHERVEGLTAETVAQAHKRDLEVQAAYGVKYLKYWFDEHTGKGFGLKLVTGAGTRNNPVFAAVWER